MCTVDCSSPKEPLSKILLFTGARSVHGCWTCRLRRKKCDETRPSCVMCTYLEIKCDGYGVKPEWMDRGPLERAKALQLKQTISHNKQRRRKQSFCKATTAFPTQGAEQKPDSILRLNVNDVSNFLDTLEAPSYNLDMYSPQQNHQFLLSHDTFNSSDTILAQDSQLVSPIHSHLRNNSAESISLQQLSQTFASSLGDQRIGLAPQSTQIITPPRSLSPCILNDGIWDDTITSSLAIFGHPNPSSPSSNASSSGKSSSEDSSDNPAEKTPLSKTSLLDQTQTHNPAEDSQVGPMDAHKEDMLFIHYLDEVFPIQFPLYHSLGRQGRGWLFSKLRRVKPAYHACLTLSQHQQNTTRPQNNVGTVPHTDNRYYNLALEQMQEILKSPYAWNETMYLSRSLETLTCILHLLFCEVLYPSVEL